jgi:hypothetical protein
MYLHPDGRTDERTDRDKLICPPTLRRGGHKKDALDLQPQVIKLTRCLPMVGGSPASFTTKTGCHDIAEILLKVALNTINQIKSNQINHLKCRRNYVCKLSIEAF